MELEELYGLMERFASSGLTERTGGGRMSG